MPDKITCAKSLACYQWHSQGEGTWGLDSFRNNKKSEKNEIFYDFLNINLMLVICMDMYIF